MLFRLAARTGRDIDELARMSSPQVSEWMAFYELEPWGLDVFDLMQANICRSIVACFGKRTPKIQDFLLFTRVRPDAKALKARLGFLKSLFEARDAVPPDA